MSRVILVFCDSTADQGQRQNSDDIDEIADFRKNLKVGELSNHTKSKRFGQMRSPSLATSNAHRPLKAASFRLFDRILNRRMDYKLAEH